jgi:hypothetical protein
MANKFEPPGPYGDESAFFVGVSARGVALEHVSAHRHESASSVKVDALIAVDPYGRGTIQIEAVVRDDDWGVVRGSALSPTDGVPAVCRPVGGCGTARYGRVVAGRRRRVPA